MADDGLLINFDVGTAPFIPQPKFKGGRWKDRYQAKRSALRKREHDALKQDQNDEQTNDPVSGDKSSDFPVEQPAKKFKALPRTYQGGRTSTSYSRNDSKNGQKRQVVSSLFSFNPLATTNHSAQASNPEPAAPSNAPLAPELQNFTSLGLSAHIAEHLLSKMSIKAPTAVQRSAISQLLKEDADAFIQAETGSGKTLAYLLPIVQKLYAFSVDSNTGEKRGEGVTRDSGLFTIILAPTRELSKQISVVLEVLLRCAHWIVATTVIGGEKMKSEKARLRKGVNILIATPGRLADHLEHTKVLDVSKVRWLVMDEGDRLMEMGFEKDIEKILGKLEENSKEYKVLERLPERRVTILCSATMKTHVQKLGQRSLKDAVHVRGVSSEGKVSGEGSDERQADSFAAPAQLQQSFAVVPAKLRLVSLVALLKRTFARKGSVMKAMIFMSCSDSVDFHFEVFTRRRRDGSKSEEAQSDPHNTSAPATVLSSKENEVHVFRLHGSLPQPIRTSTLTKYRQCKEPAVLVCTDVASRGLDLPNVDFVIEYDPPFSKDDHLHRVGRTARAGKDGRAMIFLLPGPEEGYIEILKNERSEAARHPTQHSCDDLLQKGFTATGLNRDKAWQDRATDWQLEIERWAVDNLDKLELARRAYQAHVRAYATHVAAERHMFDMTQLHLGHLAKAYALRDKPGSIRVPGLRPSRQTANANKAERRAKAGKAARKSDVERDGDLNEKVDVSSGKRKMQAKMREQADLSEFNLG